MHHPTSTTVSGASIRAAKPNVTFSAVDHVDEANGGCAAGFMAAEAEAEGDAGGASIF